jgi:lipoprotein-anchoring transpeptidase ErfK/SrfK
LASRLHYLRLKAPRRTAMRRIDTNSEVMAKARLVLAIPVLAAARVHAQETGASAPTEVRTVVVSLPDRKLTLIEKGQVKKIYTVAVGKDSTPSPTGTFKIVNRLTNPTYYHKGQIVGPGAENPVGTRWIGLDQKGYGIHGTNAPHSIGKATSHGCIRMSRKDLEEFFELVRPGDVVEIHGERDMQTMAIFNTPATTTSDTVVVATMSSASKIAVSESAQMTR